MAPIVVLVFFSIFVGSFSDSFQAVVVQANQCSGGSDCPSDDESKNPVSLLQTKLRMNVLGDGASIMKNPSAMPTLGFSDSPQSFFMEDFKAIDTDGNGKVSLEEIDTFGKTSGLTAQEIRTDFKELDSNGDGELDTQEISGLLSPSSSVPATASAEAPPSAKAEPVFAAKAEPVLVPKADRNGESIATVEAQPVPAAKAEPVVPAKAEPVPVAEATPVAMAKAEPTMTAEAKLATAAKSKPTLPTKANGIPKAIKKQLSSLEALELDARRQTGAIIATGLAQRAQALIQQGNKDGKEAELTEAKAVDLRGSARAAAESMSAESLSASEAAVNAAAKQGLAEGERLKGESEELEKEALQHHELAKQALLQASQAQIL